MMAQQHCRTATVDTGKLEWYGRVWAKAAWQGGFPIIMSGFRQIIVELSSLYLRMKLRTDRGDAVQGNRAKQKVSTGLRLCAQHATVHGLPRCLARALGLVAWPQHRYCCVVSHPFVSHAHHCRFPLPPPFFWGEEGCLDRCGCERPVPCCNPSSCLLSSEEGIKRGVRRGFWASIAHVSLASGHCLS